VQDLTGWNESLALTAYYPLHDATTLASVRLVISHSASVLM
jgi:hypothetical protein